MPHRTGPYTRTQVWEWKEQYGGIITNQLRRLGASCDWSRERFTLDAGLSASVAEAFVRLHEKGLVYRGAYMVNWSPALRTAVSDLEVEYTEEAGTLYHFRRGGRGWGVYGCIRVYGWVGGGRVAVYGWEGVCRGGRARGRGFCSRARAGERERGKEGKRERKTAADAPSRLPPPSSSPPQTRDRYPVADSPSGEFLPVATTRPETILGDTAVAVHPGDARYASLVGRELLVPCGGGRRVRVIADEYVDAEFGTGALKITPGASRTALCCFAFCFVFLALPLPWRLLFGVCPWWFKTPS